ncbi:flagellar export protein FliJ [Polynucleobacter corsicus]|uniref:flagellar export protein FliJ n=1 Tax=Polynucleobacter corsicus TaxID=2081042 RepID=UPI001BFD923F|nr:flagellar export protein FliJ [Polynucleobacter corsicus]QWE19318.1 flagellar export protein FliJ [Polynucleobacter corsicus]
MSKALNLILQFAKNQENRTSSQLKRLNGELRRSEAFNQQVVKYVQDYEKQMLDTASRGATVAFLQDSSSFRNRLQAGVEEQEGQIAKLNVAMVNAREQAIESKLRVQGIEKVLARKKIEALAERARQERLELEDCIISRLHGDSGTKPA